MGRHMSTCPAALTWQHLPHACCLPLARRFTQLLCAQLCAGWCRHMLNLIACNWLAGEHTTGLFTEMLEAVECLLQMNNEMTEEVMTKCGKECWWRG